MSKIKYPNIFKNFYFIVSVVFLLWMFFFDSNDAFTQYQRYEKLKKLETDSTYFLKGIRKIEKERKALDKNPRKLERFAREKHFLKKKAEDVYIVVEEKSNKNEK